MLLFLEKKRDIGKKRQVERMEDERGRGKGKRTAGARSYLRRQKKERGRAAKERHAHAHAAPDKKDGAGRRHLKGG